MIGGNMYNIKAYEDLDTFIQKVVSILKEIEQKNLSANVPNSLKLTESQKQDLNRMSTKGSSGSFHGDGSMDGDDFTSLRDAVKLLKYLAKKGQMSTREVDAYRSVFEPLKSSFGDRFVTFELPVLSPVSESVTTLLSDAAERNATVSTNKDRFNAWSSIADKPLGFDLPARSNVQDARFWYEKHQKEASNLRKIIARRIQTIDKTGDPTEISRLNKENNRDMDLYATAVMLQEEWRLKLINQKILELTKDYNPYDTTPAGIERSREIKVASIVLRENIENTLRARIRAASALKKDILPARESFKQTDFLANIKHNMEALTGKIARGTHISEELSMENIDGRLQGLKVAVLQEGAKRPWWRRWFVGGPKEFTHLQTSLNRAVALFETQATKSTPIESSLTQLNAAVTRASENLESYKALQTGFTTTTSTAVTSTMNEPAPLAEEPPDFIGQKETVDPQSIPEAVLFSAHKAKGSEPKKSRQPKENAVDRGPLLKDFIESFSSANKKEVTLVTTNPSNPNAGIVTDSRLQSGSMSQGEADAYMRALHKAFGLDKPNIKLTPSGENSYKVTIVVNDLMLRRAALVDDVKTLKEEIQNKKTDYGTFNTPTELTQLLAKIKAVETSLRKGEEFHANQKLFDTYRERFDQNYKKTEPQVRP